MHKSKKNNVLKGTFDGLQRYLFAKRRMMLWRWQGIKGELMLQRKRWRLNLADHIDYAYASLWDKSDQADILDEYKRIRLGELLPNSIIRKINRAYNDQTVYFESRFKRFEPSEVVKTIDQITDDALTWMTQMHVGRSQVLMGYVTQGTGTQDPDRTDTGLQTEVIRKHILDNGGYIDFLGHNELYGLIFPFDQASIACSEAGLHNTNDPTTDVTYCRNKFSPALSHTINVNAISLNFVIQHRAF